MDVLAFVMVGFAPGIFWLWVIYQRDRYIPAPVHLIVRTFLWGIVVAVPVAVVEVILIAFSGFEFGKSPDSSLLAIAYGSFVVAGITEEAAKFYVVRRTIEQSPYFRQPLDGVMFSSLWAYGLGARKQGNKLGQFVPLLLLMGMGIHGLFNFLLLTSPTYGAWALALFFMMGIVFLMMLRRAQSISPFRDRVTHVIVTCVNCDQANAHGASFCAKCGHSLTKSKVASQSTCGQCGEPFQKRSRFCPTCGFRLDAKVVSLPS